MSLNAMRIKQLTRAPVKAIGKFTKARYLEDVRKRAAALADFTIFSSDCLGGILYHDLNRKFLSPTVNLWFEERDFLKFCLSPQYYLDCDFQFLPKAEKDVPYPVGCLGAHDRRIQLHFEHYPTNQSCAEAWDRRKQRIRWDNLFVVMSDLDLTDADIGQFYQIQAKRRIMFTWHPERADGKEIFQINHHRKEHVRKYSNLNLNGFRDFEVFFDYVKWLNMEDGFMLEEITR